MRFEVLHHPEVFCKKDILINIAKLTEKHLGWSLFSNVIKKWLPPRCFPVYFAKYLRTPILQNICERLLLRIETKFPNIYLWEILLVLLSKIVL